MATAPAEDVAELRARVEALAQLLHVELHLDKRFEDLRRDRGAFAGPADVWRFLHSACLLLCVAQTCIEEAREDQEELDELSREERRAARWARESELGRPPGLGLIGWPGASSRVADMALTVEDAAKLARRQGRAAGRRNEAALPDLVITLIAGWYPPGGRAGQKWPFAMELALPVWGAAKADIDFESYRGDMRKRARVVSAPSLEFQYFAASWAARMADVEAGALIARHRVSRSV